MCLLIFLGLVFCFGVLFMMNDTLHQAYNFNDSTSVYDVNISVYDVSTSVHDVGISVYGETCRKQKS